MSNRQRDFDLGDILSITTERLVSPRLMDGVYDILNFMTGDDLFTHQLPRAYDECKPHILKQHPQLYDILMWPDGIPVTKMFIDLWLKDQKAIYGDTLTITAIPGDDHAHINPISELEAMVGADKMIVALVDGETKTQ